MSLYIDDIVNSPSDLVVAILVPQSPVSTEIEAGIGTVVGVEELLVVSIDSPCHSWPWLPYAKVASNIGTNQFLTLKFEVETIISANRQSVWIEQPLNVNTNAIL